MTGAERRQQLLDIARALFAEKGFDGTSIEEIAHRAEVSKPVVYEHFGGKEGIYAVVVDREMHYLLDLVVSALSDGHPRELLEQAAVALLSTSTPALTASGCWSDSRWPAPLAPSSLLNDIASQVEHILGTSRTATTLLAPLASQALVGMVGSPGSGGWRCASRRSRRSPRTWSTSPERLEPGACPVWSGGSAAVTAAPRRRCVGRGHAGRRPAPAAPCRPCVPSSAGGTPPRAPTPERAGTAAVCCP